jgi:hypothetical protein
VVWDEVANSAVKEPAESIFRVEQRFLQNIGTSAPDYIISHHRI